MNRLLTILALAAPILYLPLASVLPYPAGVVLKASMCVLLACLAWRHTSPLLAIALLFSAIGDSLLAVDSTRFFVPALGSFLITHVLYAVIFVRVSRKAPIAMTGWRQAGMIAAVVFALSYSFILWPHLGALAIPVVLYIAAIVAMTALSFRVPQLFVPVGAVLFMTSDSLIALGKFLWPMRWLGLVIWMTYAMGQLLITFGLLRRASSSESKQRTLASDLA